MDFLKKELLSDPWRKTAKSGWNEDELLQMRKEVMAYEGLGSTNIPIFNVLLLGQVSAGKSSIINTIESAIKSGEREEVTSKADAGSDKGSLTKQLKCYKIRAKSEDEDEDEEKLIKVQFWDTMGLEVADEGLAIDKICRIMDGEVKPKANLDGDLDERELRDTIEIKHKMHCVLFAFHAETFAILDDSIFDKLSKIRNAAMRKDIPCLVVCTAIDKVCEHVEKDTSKVFRSRNIQKKLTNVSEKSGFPPNMIHPLRNYVDQTMTDLKIDFLTMLLLKKIIQVSKNYCQRLLDDEDDC